MVHISLRQNRRSATEQNTFERHAHGPGSPLTEIPGEGFYDWAGRRLFLPHGSPDPATPGAYRYQHDPDCTDTAAPDSDPASPRYEPPHLRHQPGDTWEIGGKPHDPADPGPYGSPGWYPDTRTGRHRRGELPDPLPPEAEAEAPTRPNRIPQLPTQPDRPSPNPGPGPRRRWLPPAPAPEAEDTDEPYRFSRLREDAWDRWLVDSAPLAAAHTTRSRKGGLAAAILLLFGWIIALFTGAHHTKKEAAPGPAVPDPGTPKPPTGPVVPRPGAPEPDAPEPSAEPAPSLRHVPANPPLAKPRTGNGYIASWELAFDARHAAIGGSLA